MLTLLSQARFWTLKDEIVIKNTDFGSFRYVVRLSTIMRLAFAFDPGAPLLTRRELHSKPDKFVCICGYDLIDLVQLMLEHYISSAVNCHSAMKIAYMVYIFCCVLSYHVAYEYFYLY
jgi:hypothetical protein